MLAYIVATRTSSRGAFQFVNTLSIPSPNELSSVRTQIRKSRSIGHHVCVAYSSLSLKPLNYTVSATQASSEY